ncbi:MAG: response regulator [Actinomycetota bacterium]|nr:response regulator [Actinomycetota bacterium]
MTIRVLLVEDSPTQAMQTRLTLESQGFTVSLAANGVEALAQARNEPPDVIMSDILMPVMDGFTLVREVRDDPSLSKTPVVLHTATFSAVEDRDFALEIGADAFSEKGMASEVLGQLLRKVIGREGAPNTLDEESFAGHHNERLLGRLVSQKKELKVVNEALSVVYEETLQALVRALDVRDAEPPLHSLRVVEYSLVIARRLGLEGEFLGDLEHAALLHDIGKIGIADPILRNRGPLSETEWREMRRHPELGHDMVAHIGFLKKTAAIILAHHENWDGSGYPGGLRQEEIPLGARIFAVADALDAITSDRPYRAARSFEVALEQISESKATQFDPAVVGATLDLAPAEWEAVRDRVKLSDGATTEASAV